MNGTHRTPGSRQPADAVPGARASWRVFFRGPAQIAVGVVAMIIDSLFFGGVELVSFGTIVLTAGIVLTADTLLVRRRARRRRTETQEQ